MTPPAAAGSAANRHARLAAELAAAGRTDEQGHAHYSLTLPDVKCGGCVSKVEKTLASMDEVVTARVNLTLKRLSVVWRDARTPPQALVEALEKIGFPGTPVDDNPVAGPRDRTGTTLLRAMAVAGFAAANIMLLSVSVWAGAEGATRDLFHLVSALIAIPAVGYAGQPFFRSAIRALSARRLNMDVPIALAVVLSLGTSVFETLNHAEHAYFDASVTLLFFLLIGRYLDHLMREKAGEAVHRLASLNARSAAVVTEHGTEYREVADIPPGTLIQVALGERVPIDSIVEDGESDLDTSLMTGESEPRHVTAGATAAAGTINLTAPLTLRTAVAARDNALAEMQTLMEAAGEARARYRRIADRFAELYAPAVHALAALAFIGWMIAGAGWHDALMVAIAVLIITCPCALGLAVPIVQVVASGILLNRGILARSGSAFERMAETDYAVFDKTGTLTTGEARLIAEDIAQNVLPEAAALAVRSRHPYAQAVAAYARQAQLSLPALQNVREEKSMGVEGTTADGTRLRFGRPEWVGEISASQPDPVASGVWFARNGGDPAFLPVEESLREGAAETLAAFRQAGVDVEMLSGDRAGPVRALAASLGLAASQVRAELTPQEKTARLAQLADEGHRPLMVGDGVNDAPALAAAHASIAPAAAADISRMAADFVVLGEDLRAAVTIRETSRQVIRLVKQNFALALIYNAIAVPLALAGYATPLFAAIAMSSSSIVVVSNALRLRLIMREKHKAAPRGHAPLGAKAAGAQS